MYQYNRFVSHNEVGDSIGARGISVENFHRAMIERQARSPLSMNATSTHDTKRGEDVRARLNAIGEMAGEWEQLVRKWTGLNGDLRTVYGNRQTAPTPNEEYLIYQTIAGTFPFEETADEKYIQRMQEYLVKAMREAKQNSSWDDPDELHEKGVCDFARSMLDPGSAFLKSFIPFHRRLVWRGIVNSLVQLTIKCCSPGMPDIYRGTELWDLSLVDPDNRRPVDFSHLHDMLDDTLRKWNANPVKRSATSTKMRSTDE
jgi:maltooligosyltrehalose synthase